MTNTASSGSTLNLVELTVEQVQNAFSSSTVTSEALTRAFLDRIAELNPRYNAITLSTRMRWLRRARHVRT